MRPLPLGAVQMTGYTASGYMLVAMLLVLLGLWLSKEYKRLLIPTLILATLFLGLISVVGFGFLKGALFFVAIVALYWLAARLEANEERKHDAHTAREKQTRWENAVLDAKWQYAVLMSRRMDLGAKDGAS